MKSVKDEIYEYLCEEGATSFAEIYEDGSWMMNIEIANELGDRAIYLQRNTLQVFLALQELLDDNLIKIWWTADAAIPEYLIYVDLLTAREIAQCRTYK